MGLMRLDRGFFKIILLGLIIKAVFMPFTGHWDLTSLHQVSSDLYSLGISAAYSYPYAIYPPLAYLFLGLWQKIISVFLAGDFAAFLNQPTMLAFSGDHVFRYFFLLKFLYLPFDFGISVLIYRMFQDKKQAIRALSLWVFNPIIIYATYMWGTLDIIPTFFLVLALFLGNAKKHFLGALALGIGASFKAFPLILLFPYALFFFEFSIRRKIGMLILGLTPFFFFLFPFLTDKNFILHFFSSDQMQVIQHAGFYIGRNENISLFYIFYAFLLLFLSFRRFPVKEIYKLFFLILFVFYGFCAFTPQWFVWGLPVLIIVLVGLNLSSFIYYLIFLLYFSLVLLFEITLNIGLFAPLELVFLDYPSLGEKMNTLIGLTRINGIIRSVLSAVFLWLIYEVLTKKEHGTNI